MKKKDYIQLIIFTLIVVVATFVITMNLGITEVQIITIWIVVCIVLQGLLTSFIIFKTKQKIKREQLEDQKEE